MIAALAINISLVAIAVVIHYEMLRLLSVLIPRLRIKHRLRVLIGVFGTICAHIIEICLFGLAFYLMVRAGGFGDLSFEDLSPALGQSDPLYVVSARREMV